MAPDPTTDPALLTEFRQALAAWRAVYRRFGPEGLELGRRLARLIAQVEAEGTEGNATSQAIACMARMGYLVDGGAVPQLRDTVAARLARS